jgi:hypothetical protein
MKNVKYINIDNIFTTLLKYYPLETDETFADRMGIKIEILKNYKNSKLAPRVEIRRLLKSFFETNYISFIKLMEENSNFRGILYGVDWNWFLNKFKNNPPIEGSTFDNVCVIRAIETQPKGFEKDDSKYNDILLDEENIGINY